MPSTQGLLTDLISVGMRMLGYPDVIAQSVARAIPKIATVALEAIQGNRDPDAAIDALFASGEAAAIAVEEAKFKT